MCTATDTTTAAATTTSSSSSSSSTIALLIWPYAEHTVSQLAGSKLTYPDKRII